MSIFQRRLTRLNLFGTGTASTKFTSISPYGLRARYPDRLVKAWIAVLLMVGFAVFVLRSTRHFIDGPEFTAPSPLRRVAGRVLTWRNPLYGNPVHVGGTGDDDKRLLLTTTTATTAGMRGEATLTAHPVTDVVVTATATAGTITVSETGAIPAAMDLPAATATSTATPPFLRVGGGGAGVGRLPSWHRTGVHPHLQHGH